MDKKEVDTKGAPAAIGPYSQGIVSGDFVFCSGQLPIDPETGDLIEGDVSAEVTRVLENIRSVLEAGGSSIDKVVRLDVYLTDMGIFPEINSSLKAVFEKVPPARVTVEVSALPLGARLEIAAIAAK